MAGRRMLIRVAIYSIEGGLSGSRCIEAREQRLELLYRCCDYGSRLGAEVGGLGQSCLPAPERSFGRPTCRVVEGAPCGLGEAALPIEAHVPGASGVV